jgi:hypothetical protein
MLSRRRLISAAGENAGAAMALAYFLIHVFKGAAPLCLILHAVLVVAGLARQVAQLPAAAEVVVNRIERVGIPARVIIRRVGRDGHVGDVTRMHDDGGLSVVRTREAACGAQHDDDQSHRQPRGGGVVKAG